MYKVVEHFGLHYGQIVYITKMLRDQDLGFDKETERYRAAATRMNADASRPASLARRFLYAAVVRAAWAVISVHPLAK